MAIGYRSSGKDDPSPVSAHKHVRWLIPSIADLIFISLLGLLSFTILSVRLLGDAGIGWHIRTGQLILSSHTILRVDPFSSTMAGHPWFAWEWLYDVLAGWLDTVAGLNGVVFFTALIIAMTFSWTFRLLLQRGTNFLVALVLVLLATSAAMIHFFARPHVVSWLFIVLWFWVLESSERKDDGRRPSLWLLPALMLLWVNVHGGFLLGFALLGIYWVSASWQWFTSKDDRLDDVLQKIGARKRARDLAFIGAITALATLANPYGWRLHVHIYRYLSNRFLMDHIDEFQSPNFHGAAQKCFAVLLLLTLIALAVRKREAQGIRTSGALVVLFAVYSGLYASRNIPVSALLLILVIGPWLSDAARKLADLFAQRLFAFRSQDRSSTNFVQRMQTIELSLRTHLWSFAAIAVIGWIVFHGGSLGTTPLMRAHFGAKRFPVAAVDYLESHHVSGPVFGPDYWGGYFIYRLYPQVKVAMDDRHDFYGEEFVKSYLKIVHVEPGWNDFLNQHEVRAIVVPKDSALANILLETPRWQPIYTDDVAIVFAQTPAPTP
ncbi:MAG: hypothetical protein ABR880_12180 [Candidatus Sulfotelmatobacter sp.]|jgi:hypothetical protein